MKKHELTPKQNRQAADAFGERIKHRALAVETLSHAGRGSRSRDGELCTRNFIDALGRHIAHLQSYYGRNLFWHLDKLEKAIMHLRQGINDIMREDAPVIVDPGLEDVDEWETPEPFPKDPGSDFTHVSDHPK